MNIFDKKLSPKEIMERGKYFTNIGIILFKVLLGALGFAVLIGIVSVALEGYFFAPFIFDIDGYEWGIFFVVIDYLALLAGFTAPFFYFKGMELYALGKIASNTLPQKEVSNNSWTCQNCGTKNLENVDKCGACGSAK